MRLYAETTKQRSFAWSPQLITPFYKVYLPISLQRPYHHISQPVQPAWLSAPAARGRPFFHWYLAACWAALVFGDEATDILNRSAVKSYANLVPQLFPAIYLFLRADGAPSPLFPPSLPSPLLCLTHSPRASSSPRKVGVCANDVTLHTRELEGWG